MGGGVQGDDLGGEHVLQQGRSVGPVPVDGSPADARDLSDVLLGQGFPALLDQDPPGRRESGGPGPLGTGGRGVAAEVGDSVTVMPHLSAC